MKRLLLISIVGFTLVSCGTSKENSTKKNDDTKKEAPKTTPVQKDLETM